MVEPSGQSLPGWWLFFLSSSMCIAMVIAVVVPLFVWNDSKKKRPKTNSMAKAKVDEDDCKTIHDEPWCPRLDVKDWKNACQFDDCPWNFDGCQSVEDVLDSIWRAPLSTELQPAAEAIKEQVRDVKVAKVSLTWPDQVDHYALVYTLSTGAEVFGGAPLGQPAVGLAAGTAASMSDEGLRRRTAAEPEDVPALSTVHDESSSLPLPCLASFYRVHDGFGVLLTSKHLPVVMANPGDSVHGSCFYVYPARGLESIARAPQLVKFARVDKDCVACADYREAAPGVVYVEQKGEEVQDDESPISFIADTVRNLAGQRVVPPSYMHGAYAANYAADYHAES